MNGRRAGARRERLRERARAPETRPAGLVRLSRSRHWDVQRIVAARTDLPRRGVRRCLHASAWSVRAAVARRRDLPPNVIRSLAVDVPPVRLALAANPTIDVTTAERLARDDDPYVAGFAIGNPRVTAATIRDLTRDMQHRPAWVLRRAATNPACPVDLRDEFLTWLAIGGGGRADPLFDPAACTGDPGDGSKLPYQWYRDAIAGNGAPAQHPLWFARSCVDSESTLPLPLVHDLAVDEQRAVRVAAAKFKYRKALAALAYDEDELVRRQARLTLERASRERRRLTERRPLRLAMGVALPILLALACLSLGMVPRARPTRPGEVGHVFPTPTTRPQPVVPAGDRRVAL